MKFPFTTYEDQIPGLFIPETDEKMNEMLNEAQRLNMYVRDTSQSSHPNTLFIYEIGSFKDEFLYEDYKKFECPELRSNEHILYQRNTLFPTFLMYPLIMNDDECHYSHIEIMLIAPSKNLYKNPPNELMTDTNDLFDYFIYPLHLDEDEETLRRLYHSQRTTIHNDIYGRFIEFKFTNITIKIRWFYTMIPSTPKQYIQYTDTLFIPNKFKYLVNKQSYKTYCLNEAFTNDDIEFSNEFQYHLNTFMKQHHHTLCINYAVHINKPLQKSLIQPFINSTKMIIHYFNDKRYYIDIPFHINKSRAWLCNTLLYQIETIQYPRIRYYISVDTRIKMNSFNYDFTKHKPNIKHLFCSNQPPYI